MCNMSPNYAPWGGLQAYWKGDHDPFLRIKWKNINYLEERQHNISSKDKRNKVVSLRSLSKDSDLDIYLGVKMGKKL